MSQKELEEMGILLPEREWGKYDLNTRVNKPALISIGVLAVVSVFLMYLGDGNYMTWIGALVFIVALFLFTWLSVRSVGKQRRVYTRKEDRSGEYNEE
jgi:Ca2+/Na+ antiporter